MSILPRSLHFVEFQSFNRSYLQWYVFQKRKNGKTPPSVKKINRGRLFYTITQFPTHHVLVTRRDVWRITGCVCDPRQRHRSSQPPWSYFRGGRRRCRSTRMDACAQEGTKIPRPYIHQYNSLAYSSKFKEYCCSMRAKRTTTPCSKRPPTCDMMTSATAAAVSSFDQYYIPGSFSLGRTYRAVIFPFESYKELWHRLDPTVGRFKFTTCTDIKQHR